MRICWDNLTKLKYNRKTGLFYNGKSYFNYIDGCKTCGEEFLAQINNKGLFCSNKCRMVSANPMSGRCLSTSHKNKILQANKGRICSDGTKQKISESKKGKYENEKSPNWKGGVTTKNIPLFDTYATHISFCEEVQRDPKDNSILNVKCIYCGKWYTPTLNSVSNRIGSISGKACGEHHFYCSDNCKQSCSIFGQIKYPKGFKSEDNSQRPLQHEWSKMVKERDGHKCTKCGSIKGLIAHHKEGIRWNPIESADIDVGITLCKKCERKVHKIEGCTYQDMQCK